MKGCTHLCQVGYATRTATMTAQVTEIEDILTKRSGWAILLPFQNVLSSSRTSFCSFSSTSSDLLVCSTVPAWRLYLWQFPDTLLIAHNTGWSCRPHWWSPSSWECFRWLAWTPFNTISAEQGGRDKRKEVIFLGQLTLIFIIIIISWCPCLLWKHDGWHVVPDCDDEAATGTE